MVDQDFGAVIGLKALAFVLDNDDLTSRMFAITGLDAGALKAATQDKLTLAGILDFLLANEADLLDFCAYAKIDPREPARAQQTLTGETYFC